MCFSPEVSFASAGVLVPTGLLCLRVTAHRAPQLWPLAVVPALFGVQQACEGFVWLGLNRGDDALTVVGEASDGAEGLAASRELQPDVVLMDIRMPVRDGLSATEALLAADPDLKVIVLTTFDTDDMVLLLKQAYRRANELIYEDGSAQGDHNIMGTTLVVAVVRDTDLTMANVGDSRGYLARAGSLAQVTQGISSVRARENEHAEERYIPKGGAKLLYEARGTVRKSLLETARLLPCGVHSQHEDSITFLEPVESGGERLYRRVSEKLQWALALTREHRELKPGMRDGIRRCELYTLSAGTA